jgi:hypothetical protein
VMNFCLPLALAGTARLLKGTNIARHQLDVQKSCRIEGSFDMPEDGRVFLASHLLGVHLDCPHKRSSLHAVSHLLLKSVGNCAALAFVLALLAAV